MVAKNMISGVLAQAIGAGLILLTNALIARHLGVAGYGDYAFVLAFVTIFQIAADIGVTQILVRDVAGDRGNAAAYIGLTKSLMWLTSLATVVLIAVAINIKGASGEVTRAAYVGGIGVLAMLQVTFYNSIFQAFEDMEFNAMGFTLHKVASLAFVYACTRMGWGIVGIFGSFSAANLLLWSFYRFMSTRRYGRYRMVISPAAWWRLCRESISIGVTRMLRMVTWQVDILILSALTGQVAVGVFGGAYRLISAVNTLPVLVAVPLFPVFSRLSKDSPREMAAAYEKSMKLFCILSLPIAILVTIMAERIVHLLLGPDFSSSATALRILIWAVVFLFPTTLYMFVFTAIGKQHLYTLCSVICLGVNIVMDLVLIPHYSYIGACFGTLAAELSLFCAGYYFLWREGITASFPGFLLKTGLSAAAMGLVAAWLMDDSILSYIYGLGSGAFVYVLLLFVLQTFSHEEIRQMKDAVGLSRARAER
jgi:O-antigen/teichoic acid export membrane protein